MLNRKRHDIENRLRKERPAAPDDLVRRLTGGTEKRRTAPRKRLGVVFALTTMLVLAFSLTGGIGYAASSLQKGSSAVRELVAPRAKPSTGQSGQKPTPISSRGSARNQYNEKVVLCHKPEGQPWNAHTIRVPQEAVAAHLAHGDYLGPCKNEKKQQYTVCHFPQEGQPVTILVLAPLVDGHLSHGDYIGPCRVEEPTETTTEPTETEPAETTTGPTETQPAESTVPTESS